MKMLSYSVFIVVLIAGVAAAQSPTIVHTSKDLGTSIGLPADWQVVDTSAAAQEKARENAQSEDEKKGLACVQVGLTARHGTPPSVITQVALPFACFGQQVSESDLPGFASGVSAGLQQNLTLGEPEIGSYSLGTHRFWIERVSGSLKGDSSGQYTVEIACTVTKEAAVCWMTMAANAAALSTFEHSPVSLDGEEPAALVPASAFDKKPS